MKFRTVVEATLGFALLGSAGRFAGAEDLTVILPALENGDVNGDWAIDVTDPIFLWNHLFSGGPAPVPLFCGAGTPGNRNGDANGDGAIDVSDGVGILLYLFRGGPGLAPAGGIGLGSGGEALKTLVAARLVFDVPDPPAPDARVWIDGGGNLHIRNAQRAATVSGDFEGRFYGVASLDVDAATFLGTGFGTFDMDVTWEGRTGRWSGSYSARLEESGFVGRFVAQGSGGLSGTRIFGTTVSDVGEDLVLSGEVLTTDH